MNESLPVGHGLAVSLLRLSTFAQPRKCGGQAAPYVRYFLPVIGDAGESRGERLAFGQRLAVSLCGFLVAPRRPEQQATMMLQIRQPIRGFWIVSGFGIGMRVGRQRPQ